MNDEEKKQYWCDTCNKGFSTKGNLAYHKKTNKKCIKERGSVREISNICKYCDGAFLERRQLERHLDKCTVAKKILKYEQKIQTLEATIIAMKGKSSRNYNLPHLDMEILQERFDATKDLFVDAISEGPTQLGIYTGKYIFRGFLICSSLSRYTIHYMNDDKQIKDPKGLKITKIFFDLIKPDFPDLTKRAKDNLERHEEKAKRENPEMQETAENTFQEYYNNIFLIKKLQSFQKTEDADYANIQASFIKGLCQILSKEQNI